jgi:hypothetical protein
MLQPHDGIPPAFSGRGRINQSWGLEQKHPQPSDDLDLDWILWRLPAFIQTPHRLTPQYNPSITSPLETILASAWPEANGRVATGCFF